MKKLLLIASVAGLAFSGYISGVKLFTSTCAFSESCPYFLGYPTCYYGFALFLVLTIASYLLVFGRVSMTTSARLLQAASFLGILFAGYFTLKELPLLFSEGLGAYMLGLPTCALGLIFFVFIFAGSLRIRQTI